MLQFQILLINMLILSLEELYFSQGKFFFIPHLNNKISFFFPDFFSFFFLLCLFFLTPFFYQGFLGMMLRVEYIERFFLLFEEIAGVEYDFVESFSTPVSSLSRRIKVALV